MTTTIPSGQPTGFVEYGSGDSSILYSHALTSLPSGATKGGAGAASINFDSILGVQLTNTGSLLLPALTAGQQTLLDRGGQINFEVEHGWFQSTYKGSGNEYLFLFKDSGSNSFGVEKPNNSANIFSVNNGTGLSQKAVLCEQGPAKGSHSLVTISWTNKEVSVYRDYMLVMKNTWSTHVAGMLANLYVGGTASGAFNSVTTYRVRNFCVSSRPVVRPVDSRLSDVIVLGHSFAVNGDYPNADFAIIGGSASGSYQDGGWIPQLHRYLSPRGRHFGLGRVTSYAVAGTKIASAANSCAAQITTATAAGHRAPTAAVIMTGVNDLWSVADNGLTSQFQTDFQTVITQLVALNSNIKIVVCNLTNPTGYTGNTWYQSNVIAANAYVDAVVAANSANCRKADIFGALGGWSNKVASDFIADHLHPDKPGYAKVGNCIGGVLHGWLV